jgi:dTDP-N-acetylfucosamine:lipid II N-acetylfucosaminyltransferase
MARSRIANLVTTSGNMLYYRQRHPRVLASLLYFATRGVPALAGINGEKSQDEPMTILVGSSGDRRNQHIDALEAISSLVPISVWILPMGYPTNNDIYLEQVRVARL